MISIIRFKAPPLPGDGGREECREPTPLVFDVHIRQLQSSNYGLFVWPSAILLAEFLSRHRSLFHGKRIMELGAGVGLPGIVAAKLGATGACHRAALGAYFRQAVLSASRTFLSASTSSFRHALRTACLTCTFRFVVTLTDREDEPAILENILHNCAANDVSTSCTAQARAPHAAIIKLSRSLPSVFLPSLKFLLFTLKRRPPLLCQDDYLTLHPALRSKKALTWGRFNEETCQLRASGTELTVSTEESSRPGHVSCAQSCFVVWRLDARAPPPAFTPLPKMWQTSTC